MADRQTQHQAPTHPVILLARTVAVLLGILAAAAHFTLVWVAVSALTGYAFTLWAMRGRWPAIPAPTTQAGKTR